MSDRKEIDPERMREIEAWNRELGRFIDMQLNWGSGGEKKIGFALLVFSFDGPEFNYISNAQRDDMVKMFVEAANRLRGSDPLTSNERN